MKPQRLSLFVFLLFLAGCRLEEVEVGSSGGLLTIDGRAYATHAAVKELEHRRPALEGVIKAFLAPGHNVETLHLFVACCATAGFHEVEFFTMVDGKVYRHHATIWGGTSDIQDFALFAESQTDEWPHYRASPTTATIQGEPLRFHWLEVNNHEVTYVGTKYKKSEIESKLSFTPDDRCIVISEPSSNVELLAILLNHLDSQSAPYVWNIKHP
jgi:hypothetical protein